MESTLRVQIVQPETDWCDPVANRARIERLLSTEGERGDLIVLPEMFTTGFCMEPERVAEPEDGMTLAWMRRLCRERDCALTGSIAVRVGEEYYNRCYFVTPDGGVRVYDKRHLFAYGGEDRHYRAGRERVVVAWRGVRFLLQVCYDLRFPVFARNRGDYDVLICVANWPEARIAAWDALLTARAIENQCYVLAANRTGCDPVARYTGHSRVIDAYGRLVAQADEGCEAVITVTLDLERQAAFRRKFPVLADGDPFELR